jgi:hypothetical protein
MVVIVVLMFADAVAELKLPPELQQLIANEPVISPLPLPLRHDCQERQRK